MTTREPITSLKEFFRSIEYENLLSSREYFFRGHDQINRFIKPKLFRDTELESYEKNLLREIITLQPDEFASDETTFERLVRAQHYGLPTRLLDLTRNPLIALYFACLTSPSKDGELVRFSCDKRRVKYYDSDTVSCISNLSYLDEDEHNALFDCKTDDELNNEDSETYNRYLHFIKSEKPYFLPKIRISDLKSVVPVIPKLSNRRVTAQQGAFLIFGMVASIRPRNNENISVRRKIIPASAKPLILRELDKVNINAGFVYPEIDKVTGHIVQKIKTASVEKKARRRIKRPTRRRS